ncbi:hypothetical protein CAEBREN_16704 [Caenorhabditis brenneri]|uniref:Integrase catalytic domain-containing protein n=1 Tax=Caenorhabditis brenneri TaxID=135651 RepID=G0MAK9_CAEBE|nr:hypothetical protein CAEBREN_16704 [Caenorhabditis brenneri]
MSPLGEDKVQVLEKLYHDPIKGLRGISTLLAQAKKINSRISRKDVITFLHSNNTYTRNYPVVKKTQHNPWVATGPDSHHMADLAMLPALKRFNKGYCYILVVVDVFSRFVFTRPLKNKTCITVTKAYEDILWTSWRIPSRLYTDKGTEFMGKKFREFVNSLGITHMNPKNTNVKACYAENAIMRIKNKLEKWFTAKQSYEWTRVLDDIVDGLNSTYMDSIGTCPKNVNSKNSQKVWNRLYNTIQSRNAKYKLGDTVRILMESSPFSKGTRARWSEEVFRIVKIVPYDIPIYILADMTDEWLDGIWYEEELVLYNNTDNSMKIDKIIRKRKRKGISECFVSFLGHSPAHNRWILESDLSSF